MNIKLKNGKELNFHINYPNGDLIEIEPGYLKSYIIGAFGSPTFKSHDTVSKSCLEQIQEWCKDLGYTEFEHKVIDYNFPIKGWIKVNMK